MAATAYPPSATEGEAPDPERDRAADGEGGAEAADLPWNRVAVPGFPHKRVWKFWDGKFKYAKKAYEQNEIDWREFLQYLHGSDSAEADPGTAGSTQSRDARFSSQLAWSDFNKLVSFYSNRDPRTTCRPAKGPDWRTLAEATAMFSDRCAHECGDKAQDALAIAEAIGRNHGYVRCNWDHRRWLPIFQHVKGEVYLDPDCEGDVKAARHSIEVSEMSLSSVLADESIPADLRSELREKKDCHRRSRVMREGAITNADADKDYSTDQPWDGESHSDKVLALKIFSRDGVLPGERLKPEDTKEARAGGGPKGGGKPGSMPGLEVVEVDSIHKILKATPEPTDDVPPDPAAVAAIDGRRVYVLMIVGFEKILKVTPWPMDHFDHDEIPYVECRPSVVPGLLHGVAIFRAIRPYLKIINRVIEFWIESERAGAKRIVEVDKNAVQDQTELDKIDSRKLYERVMVDQTGGIKVTEFAGRLTSFKDLLPAMLEMHDNVTGINEAVSGRAPDVEETASAAKMRQDQAVAALSYLENAVQDYHEKKARMRVAALQCYVPKFTVWEPCDACGGRGATMIDTDEGEALAPCEACQMSGRKPGGRPLKKGADWWLPAEQAEAWRDDLSLEEIRSEVIVGVEPGSSRTDYAERRLAMLTMIADRYVVPYMQWGLPNRAQAIIRAQLLATEAPGAEDFVPTVQELQEAAQRQAQMAAEAQAGAGKAGKSPEELQMQAADLHHKQAMEERRVQIEEAKASAEVQIRAAQVDVQNRQVMVQAEQVRAQERTAARNAAQQAAQKQAEMSLKAAESAKPPEVDPVKAAEVEGKLALEEQKLALEAERMEFEREKAAEEAERAERDAARQAEQSERESASAAEQAERDSQREAEQSERDCAAKAAEQESAKALMAEVQAALAEQEKRLTATFREALQEIATAVKTADAVPEKGQDASGGAESPAIQAILKALNAPRRTTILRDKDGRAMGAESVATGPETKA